MLLHAQEEKAKKKTPAQTEKHLSEAKYVNGKASKEAHRLQMSKL